METNFYSLLVIKYLLHWFCMTLECLNTLHECFTHLTSVTARVHTRMRVSIFLDRYLHPFGSNAFERALMPMSNFNFHLLIALLQQNQPNQWLSLMPTTCQILSLRLVSASHLIMFNSTLTSPSIWKLNLKLALILRVLSCSCRCLYTSVRYVDHQS